MRVSVALLALATAASAQSQNYTSSLDMTIDPNTVDPADRSTWCRAQGNTCRTLCSNSPSSNDCDPTDLSYECLCSANNSAPGLQFYTQTVPTFICQAILDQCITQNVGSQRGQEECRSSIETLCGTQNPPSADEIADSTSSTTADSTTTAASQTSSDAAAETNVSTTESDGLAAPTAGPKAVGALAAIGLVAAFI